MTPGGFFLEHIWIVPLLPLLSAVLMFLLRRPLPKSAVTFLCVGSVFLSFAFSLGAVWQLVALPARNRVFQQILFEWMTPGVFGSGGVTRFVADWGYLLDPLSCVAILAVSLMGLFVHIYSVGAMRKEDGYYRFLGLLNLCLFFMLTLILANNLLLLFVGWAGTGLSSVMLIGFHFRRQAAVDASRRALVVNLIADGAFLLGICLIASRCGTVRFTSQGLSDPVTYPGILQTIAALIDQHRIAYGAPVLTVAALLLFVGAAIKSSQFPVHTWLAGAVETPVAASALMQGVALATAGVYVIARLNAIYQLAPIAMNTMAVVGSLSAVLGALCALTQSDALRVLAYSTTSQAGLMYLALGAGAFNAGIFQWMTHAFFKTMLVLGAGAVIFALSGEQDLRKMGGLYNTLPKVSRSFLIATLAMAGCPVLAGFFSEQQTLTHAFHTSRVLWFFGWLAMGLTALYSFRLFFLMFRGRSRVPIQIDDRIQQPPASMVVPVMLLILFCLAGGWAALPTLWSEKNYFAEFLAPTLGGFEPESAATRVLHQQAMAIDYVLMAALIAIVAGGVWLAYRLYLKNAKLHTRIAEAWPATYQFFAHALYVDPIYEAVLVNRAIDLSESVDYFDRTVIEGAGIDGTAAATRFLSRVAMWWDEWVVDGLIAFGAKLGAGFSIPVRMLQTGRLTTYAAMLVLGFVILLGYYGHHMQEWVRNLH